MYYSPHDLWQFYQPTARKNVQNVLWFDHGIYSYQWSISDHWIVIQGACWELENVTLNSITNNLKIRYADVCKASKNKDVKWGEIEDILTQNMKK